MVFRGGGIGALPGCAVGSLAGAFFERGGTNRSFDDEINVSSCKLCTLSLMLAAAWPNAIIGDESGEDGVVEDTELEWFKLLLLLLPWWNCCSEGAW